MLRISDYYDTMLKWEIGASVLLFKSEEQFETNKQTNRSDQSQWADEKMVRWWTRGSSSDLSVLVPLAARTGDADSRWKNWLTGRWLQHLLRLSLCWYDLNNVGSLSSLTGFWCRNPYFRCWILCLYKIVWKPKKKIIVTEPYFVR